MRISAAVVTVALVASLVVAANLTPSPSGIGTHQQLGLPPCSARLTIGIRCPACGMTTSWAHFVRGQWLMSMQANLGGFLLALYAVATIILGTRVFFQARLPSLNAQKIATIALVGIAIIAICEWGARLAGAL